MDHKPIALLSPHIVKQIASAICAAELKADPPPRGKDFPAATAIGQFPEDFE